MSEIQKRRKQFFANKMHKEMFYLIFFASLIPAMITAVALFYLIFNITAEQFGIPEAIAYNLIPAAQKVTIVILIAAPAAVALIMFFAHKITHRTVGPFDRIVRELDENIAGKRKSRIVLRKNDKFWPLVDRINTLIDKLNRD